MSKILPRNRPKMTLKQFKERFKISANENCVIWVRGYYKNTMGIVDKNDRGMYDDACFLYDSKKKIWRTFNGNVDPDGTINPHGAPTIIPGEYQAQKWGMHKGRYLALVQRGLFHITRDKLPGKIIDSVRDGLNGHRGGQNRVDSHGCQTIPPSQYADWIATLKRMIPSTDRKSFFTTIILEA